MMKKKAQGLSLNMVVVGAISIVVVVVIIIFVLANMQTQEQLRDDAKGGSTCGANGGTIRTSATECYAVENGRVMTGTFSDVKGSEVCCTE
jgi:hypothetical protein